MRLYNTLASAKEDFTVSDGVVKMYVCGITPYAGSHVGHAMSAVVFDVVRRYMEFKGFEVRHVQNFTDIDDKMIVAAAKEGITVEELAERNIAAFLADMDTLNVKRATVYPRATQEIEGIVDMILRLEERGFAYSVNGDVYFRVRKDPDYGKLGRRNLEDMIAGARLEVDEQKDDVMDFALWKGKKPGEPAWDSPWGPGRPGWHIECSAMVIRYLDQTIDIHGGGRDLVFPHHENEIAQSEAYSSVKPFARFWMHNGMVQFGDDKMSKSIGNIVEVRDALEKHEPDALRLFFLSSHYRSPVNYTDDSVEGHARALGRLRQALEASSGPGAHLDPGPYEAVFVEAMDDDLNTPRAIAALFDLAREINRSSGEDKDVADGQAALRKLAGLLGITLEESPERGGSEDVAPFVDLLVELRAEIRQAKRFDLADRVRDELAALGISLQDSPEGTTWSRS